MKDQDVRRLLKRMDRAIASLRMILDRPLGGFNSDLIDLEFQRYNSARWGFEDILRKEAER